MNRSPIDLDALLIEARAQQPMASDDFLETALANAYAQMPSLSTGIAVSEPPQPRLFQGFSGWFSFAALTASALLGVWIGYADWRNLATSSGLSASYDAEISALDSFDGIDALLTEG